MQIDGEKSISFRTNSKNFPANARDSNSPSLPEDAQMREVACELILSTRYCSAEVILRLE